eukprot:scaffold7862_cov94-Skeletonema_dohrnii-CCMP3373.AAC.4
MKTPSPPILPPRALHWSIAASTAAAISYADRGAHRQLQQVQSAFFVGYALTQVFGGVLGGRSSSSTTSATGDTMTEGSYNSIAIGSGSSDNDDYYGKDKDAEETKLLNINNSKTAISSTTQQQQQKRQEGYRRILPLSLVLTGITTILFPMAAMAGPNWAILDRFSLGLLEGVLLPAAMAGVSSTTTTTTISSSSTDGIIVASDTTTTTLERNNSIKGNNKDIKATASAIVIAGCYLGSAWAYLSAWIIFSETSQVHLAQWGFLQQDSATASVWPLLFYINGILSLFITLAFGSEFDLSGWRNNGGNSSSSKNNTKKYDESTDMLSSSAMVIMKDVIAIAKETLSSKSGRAIVAAQIGQGALLYSIASWGPLYLERIADASTTTATAVDTTSSLSFVSSTAVAASIAASSLIVPQITKALIGMSIGVGADKLSATIGSRLTRRSLQFISGVGPAMILVYLSLLASDSNSGDGTTTFQSPAFLFGAAQTISAISLGAVSVSHLEVATPSKSGAVYALGNVFAAISGSITVTLFGVLLDKDGQQQQVATTTAASDFSLPFQIVAILSAVGSIFYSLSIESDLEIGMEETKKDHQSKSR